MNFRPLTLRGHGLRVGTLALGLALGLAGLLSTSGCTPTTWDTDTGQVVSDSLRASETVLDNGMRLVIHEDHRIPVVKVLTVVGVGSADEPPGRGGFAHLFEHLMFSGTTAAPDFDVAMEAVGGSNNAWTDVDQTVYHETAPAHALGTVLWLEADRFANLGSSISQTKIDVQRDVVLNEMRQSVLDEPGGGAYEAASSALFAKGHPYYRPVIGSIDDLERTTRADVVDFFTRYYRPANLTLIIAGDIDTDTVRTQVQQLHGQIQDRSVDSSRVAASGTRLRAKNPRCRPCRQQFVDAVSAPRVSTTYQWAAARTHGSFVDPSLEAATAMANDTYTNQLQIDLVRERKVANWVSFGYDPKELAQFLSIEAEAADGVTADELRTELTAALQRLARTGFTKQEVAAVKTAARGGSAAQMEEPNGRGDILQEVVTRYGTTQVVPGSLGELALQHYGRRFRTVTATSATRRLRWVLEHADRVEQVVLPGDRGEYPDVLIASSGKPTGRLLKAPLAIQFARPAATVAAAVTVPNPSASRLANGVRLSHFNRPDAPTVELVLMFTGGGERDPVGKEGRGSMMAEMMTRGAGTRNAVELSQALGQLGSSISVNGSADRYTVAMSAPPDQVDATLSILADILQRPTFASDELDRAQNETIAAIESQQSDASALAFYAGVRDFFPLGHPSSRFASASSVDSITTVDLRTEHLAIFQPQNAEIVSGGPVAAEAMTRQLAQALAGWKNSGTSIIDTASISADPRPMHTVLVDVPDASQTQILYLALGPNPADPEIVAAGSSAFVLGGAFTSRLNRSLREEKGYTYGASAGLLLGEKQSVLQASTSVEQRVTRPAVKELLRIINGFDAGDITDNETASATSASYASSVGLISTNGALVYTFVGLRDLGLNWDQVTKRLNSAQRLSKADLATGARALIDDRRVTLVIAGDLKAIRPQLRGLDLGTISETTVDLR